MRSVETILFPQTRVELLQQTHPPHIWSIKTSAYPYPGEFFIDARFLTKSGTERTAGLPSIPTILKTMRDLVGARYIWGGNWPHGIDLLPQFYPGKTPLEKRDLLTQETWTLKGFDCSGLLHYATDGWTPRNTSRLIGLGIPVDIEGKNTENIIDSLQELDLIVWAGHVVCVFDRQMTIESKISVGVVTFDIDERLNQIMQERRPVNDWGAYGEPRFVVRRWHPGH